MFQIKNGFSTYADQINHMMRGYSLINTPVVDVSDIGNCYDHLEQILSIRLVPVTFVKGDTNVDKVMSYQKINFMESLQQIALTYRGWKTIDFNHLRDTLLDYFLLDGDVKANEVLGRMHNIEYVFTSTKKPNVQHRDKMYGLGATNLIEALEINPDDDILFQIQQAETNGDEERAYLLKNIHMISTELDITVDHDDTNALQRRISILNKRLEELKSSSPQRHRSHFDKKHTERTNKTTSVEQQREKAMKEIFE